MNLSNYEIKKGKALSLSSRWKQHTIKDFEKAIGKPRETTTSTTTTTSFAKTASRSKSASSINRVVAVELLASSPSNTYVSENDVS